MAASETAPDWSEIEARDGFAGMRRVVESDLIPALERAPIEAVKKDGAPKDLERITSLGFFSGLALFLPTFIFLPETWWGIALRFLLFPVCFIVPLVLVARLNWRTLMNFFLRAETRFGARTEGLQAVAGRVGLTYVPMPGGPPAPLALLARQSWMPGEFRQLVARLETHGGMDDAVGAARRSGLMTSDVVVLGNEEAKEKYREQFEQSQQLEDGFEGVRNGASFAMFEWVERVSEAPDIHHLMIVLKAPFKLSGVTELRSRKISWLRGVDKSGLNEVSLEAVRFADHFRLRSTDQIESRALFNPAVIERVLALADRGKFRAVASGDHLVFAFEGTDRFALLDLGTGKWDDGSIRRGLTDLADALGLVDALAHAFMVRQSV